MTLVKQARHRIPEGLSAADPVRCEEEQITAIATVPGAASVSPGDGHAVVLLSVNQTVIVRRRRTHKYQPERPRQARQGRRPLAHLGLRPD